MAGWGDKKSHIFVLNAGIMIGKEFQTFLKPVGSACNLRCSYCYYLSKNAAPAGKSVFHDSTVAEELIRQHITASDDVVFFSWHGGEPMLAGIDFYREMVMLQKKLGAGRKIVNGIQTNATLIDDQWARFLGREKFVVGVSMDGPEYLHDAFRSTKNGSGTFKSVFRGYTLLQKHGIQPEILCVVNSVNASYPIEVYRFFKSLGAQFMTFLPLVERTGHTENVSERSVKARDFGNFMAAIFDEWVEQDIGRVKVQLFEEAGRKAFRQDHTLCIFKKTCGGVPVIDYNGDFYSCDHFVDDEHKLGNILQKPLEKLINLPEQEDFGNKKYNELPEYCINCNVLEMCNGECPKNRFIKTPTGETGLNYLCEGYKLFFNHCLPFVNAVSELWSRNQGRQG